jgi:outer membrane protein assembly factor BamB
MRKIYLTILTLPLLYGCADKKILEGKKESIFQIEKERKRSTIIVELDAPVPVDSLENLGNNSKRCIPHAVLGENLKLSKMIFVNSDTRNILCPPLVLNDHIFILGHQDILHVYDFNSGEKVWELPLAQQDRNDLDATFGGGIAHKDGILYISTSLGELSAVSIKDQKILWKKTLSGIARGAPVVEKDYLYVVTENNRTAAYSIKTGNPVWTHEGIPESASVAVPTSPTSSEHAILSPYSSGELVALKPHNGSYIWLQTLGTSKGALARIFAHVTANPIVKGDFVYAGSLNNQFSKISLKDGNSIWDAPVSSMGLPILSGNTLFLTTSKHTLIALSESTGEIIWETQLPKTNPDLFDKPIQWAPPALGGGKLYVAGTAKEMLVINAITGVIEKKIELPDLVTIQPIVVKNSLLLVTQEGQILIYR